MEEPVGVHAEIPIAPDLCGVEDQQLLGRRRLGEQVDQSLGGDEPLPRARRGECLERAGLGAEQERPLVVGDADRREVDDDRPSTRSGEAAPQCLFEGPIADVRGRLARGVRIRPRSFDW